MESDRRSSYRLPIDATLGRQVSFYPIGLLGRVGRVCSGHIDNLSRDGASVCFGMKTRRRKKIWIQFHMSGALSGLRVKALVMWTEKVEGRSVRAGVKFLSPPPQLVLILERMAYDHKVCEAGIAFSLKDVCKRTCAYWDFCKKPVKLIPAV